MQVNEGCRDVGRLVVTSQNRAQALYIKKAVVACDNASSYPGNAGHQL